MDRFDRRARPHPLQGLRGAPQAHRRHPEADQGQTPRAARQRGADGKADQRVGRMEGQGPELAR